MRGVLVSKQCGVEVLLGKTLTAVKRVDNRELLFPTADGKQYRMDHSQDCCESVTIEDICGDLQDLVGTPLLIAEEVSSRDACPDPTYATVRQLRDEQYSDDSHTWTFYKFATVKGHVTIRWYGSSNGYYSESVDFCEVSKHG